MNRIAIVYFAYINKDKNWKRIISSQLDDLKRSGILSEADLFIEVSDPNNLKSVHYYFDNLINITILNTRNYGICFYR